VGGAVFACAVAMTEQGGSVNIPQSFSLFKIIPKPTEVDDANIPRSIFAAIALFHSTGNSTAAGRCHDCLTSTLNLLAAGPDGKTEIKIGSPCLCWECGFLGIPDIQIEEGVSECRNCKSSLQTNTVEGLQPDGSQIPWIEKKSDLS
jgi:hypothetical protein